MNIEHANKKRGEKYRRIASVNGCRGEYGGWKAVDKTESGHFVNTDGKWAQK